MTAQNPPSRPDDDQPSAETVALTDIDTSHVADRPSADVAPSPNADELHESVAPDPEVHPEAQCGEDTVKAPAPRARSPRAQSKPRNLRRVVLRTGFFVALVGCLGWGVVEALHWTSIKPKPPRAGGGGGGAEAGAPADVPDPAAELTPSETPADDEPSALDEFEIDDASYPGRRALTFLRTHVKQVDSEGEGSIVELAGSEAIAAQAVTVVNLWATWCKPCRAEFSGFQSMFALNSRHNLWGSETRFVPILVDDAEHARTAYKEYGLSMPPIHASLVDLKLDRGGVRGGLEEMEISADAALPITLLFDCRRKLRWKAIGALDQAHFNTLADEIDKLRAELRLDKCRIKRQVAAGGTADTPADAPRKPSCNPRKECDAEPGCDSCGRECRCPKGQTCNLRPDGQGVCKESI